jgi:hypothetical protein
MVWWKTIPQKEEEGSDNTDSIGHLQIITHYKLTPLTRSAELGISVEEIVSMIRFLIIFCPFKEIVISPNFCDHH